MDGPVGVPGLPHVEFAPWPTDVQDDSLNLMGITFEPRSASCGSQTDPGSSFPEAEPRSPGGTLLAMFADARGAWVARFAFHGIIAFRVLDENGLVEIWEASAVRPRPARTTFKVRGHGWTRESVLVFALAGSADRYSYVVATDDLCLEVVSAKEPVVTILRAGGD